MRGEKLHGSAFWSFSFFAFAGLLLIFPILDAELETDRAFELSSLGVMALIAALLLVLLRSRIPSGLFSVDAIGGSVLLAALLVVAGREEDDGLLLAGSIVLATTALAALMSGKTKLAALVLIACTLLLVDPRGDPSDALVGWSLAVSWSAALGLTLAGVGLLPEHTARLPRTGLHTRLRRLLTRRYVDNALDWIRFRIDTFPRGVGRLAWLNLPELQSAVYQELPWVGLRAGRRTESTSTRWSRMRPVVEACGAQSALDIGSNVGWFAFTLAELGVPTIAVERSARFIRIALYAKKKALTSGDVSFLAMDVTPRNVESLPQADAVILLSIWHHFVREHGFEGATTVLSRLWERTGRVLFFESGEDEMPASWGLPEMTPHPAAWIEQYLEQTCPGSRIVHLGLHDALGPDNEPCQRNLFAVIRD